MDSSSDKFNLSAPEIGKSRKSRKDKDEFEIIRKVDELLNCSADTALRKSKTTKSSRRNLSFLERQKLRFKLLEGVPQRIVFSQDSVVVDTVETDSKPCEDHTATSVKKQASNILKSCSKTLVTVDKKEENQLTKEKEIERKCEEQDSSFKKPDSPSVRKTSSSRYQGNRLPSRNNMLLNNNLEQAQKCSMDFQTGSGKKIEVSERALKRASKIFDDIIDLSPTAVVDESYQLNINIERKNSELVSALNKPNVAEINSFLGVNNTLKSEISNSKFELHESKSVTIVSSDKENILDTSSEESPTDIIEAATDKLLHTNFGNATRSKKKKKVNLNDSAVSSPTSKKFTQVSETQMCWVAENAECLMEATDSQWNSEPNTLNAQIKPKMQDDFEDLSTQEAEFFGNVSFSGNAFEEKTVQDFIGFYKHEADEAYKRYELYRQSTNYIKADISRKKFFPISFIFEDVKLNMQQSRRVNQYSLRSSQNRNSASPKYKTTRRKGLRKSGFSPKKKLVENILKSTLKNKYKKNILDATLTSVKEENSLDESFTEICSSPAGKRSKRSKSRSASSLSSTLSDITSVSSGSQSIKNSNSKRKNTKQLDVTVHEPTLESIPIKDENNKAATGEIKCLDEIFDAPTQIYNPPESAHLEPELFEDYDVFEETIVADSNAESKEKISESQESKRKSTSTDELNMLDKKRIKISKETNESTLDSEEHQSKSTSTAEKIQISQEFLKEAEKIFANVDEDLECSRNKSLSIPSVDQPIKKTKHCSSDIGIEYNKMDKFNNDFSTASGKNIVVSEESLNKVKNIFADCDVDFQETTRNSKKDFPGFTTAAGKKISILEESLQKAKKLFSDCEDLNDEKEIHVPEEFRKEKNVEENQSVLKNKWKGVDFGFSTAAGKKIEVSEEALKRAENLFADCEHEKLTEISSETNENFEFKTAAGKPVQFSEKALEKARKMFADCEDMENYSKDLGISTAEGKKIEVPEKAMQEAKQIYADCEQPEINNDALGFATAAGRKINVTNEALQTAKKMFNDGEESFGFSAASGKQIEISEEALQKSKRMFAECENDIPSNSESKEQFEFSSAGGKRISITDEAIQKTKNIFADLEDVSYNKENYDVKKKTQLFGDETVVNKEDFGFSTAGGKKIEISEESLKRTKGLFSDCNDMEQKVDMNVSSSATRRKLEDAFGEYKKVTVNKFEETKWEGNAAKKTQIANESTPVVPNRLVRNVSSKKRLGISSCRQINISENSMKKAKLIFEDIDSPQSSKSFNLNGSFGQYSSTPLKHTQQNTPKCSPFHVSENRASPNTTLTTNDLTLLVSTPKSVRRSTTFTDTNLVEELSDTFSRFNFRSSQNTNSEERKCNMMKEYELTKMKISVIENRLRMFEKQQELLKNKPPEYKRLIPGCLYKQKAKSSRRVTLKQAVEGERPGKFKYQEALTSGVPPSVLELTAENATKLNFFVPWWPNSQHSYPPVIQTEDKAIVIPNELNNIGLPEIEPAFLTTPGIDATLLPRGWVENHFRWIVWKLACMERSFPEKFTNLLTVENVVSQLKYRYDREIDRAQRPAIRKILERDDVAGRRLVLCVAAVYKTANQKYELELTDGWYSIKASIDSPLHSLVERNVIKPGMKLMLHGAELSNCDACHPLDTPDGVHLLIHYNSTRRAAWYVKLGYQRNPGPFCINLRTIHSNGGSVSCASAYVARVYPLSYMERLENTVIWRNIKAEQRSATQWETKHTEVMERLQQRVQQQLEREWIEETKNQKKTNIKLKDIQNITCPKTLYHILESSNDPESIKEAMTPSQCCAVQDYSNRLVMSRQEAVSMRLREMVSKENVKKRDVCSVLKLLLVDMQSPYHTRFLSIWRPKDSHFQELREGNAIRMYNVTVKNNGSLSSIPRTQFEVDKDADTEKFEHMERKVTPICETQTPNYKAIFNEFDTVGMVVYVDVQQFNQTIWLVDENFRFLMVKVTEGPETCLFDGISLGKIVTVTNLIFQKYTKRYTEAVANHYSIFSSYPTQSYLQYFLKAFIEHMPQDVDKYLDECKDSVEIFLAQNAMQTSLLNITMNSMSQVEELKNRICGLSSLSNDTDTLTLSDEELSSFDTQNILY